MAGKKEACMKIDPIMAVIAGLILVSVGLEMIFYEKYRTPISDISTVLMAAMATIICYQTTKSRGYMSPPWKIWMLITLGMFLWFIGELGWGIYELALNIKTPYPSILDIAYLLAYLPIGLGMALNLDKMSKVIRVSDLWMTCAIAIISFLLLTAGLFLSIIESGVNTLEKTIDIAYPLLDLFLFFSAFLTLIIYTKRMKVSGWGIGWLVFTMGMIFETVADSVFSYLTLSKLYRTSLGIIPDAAFLTAYGMFAIGAYMSRLELRKKS